LIKRVIIHCSGQSGQICSSSCVRLRRMSSQGSR
jgi:hypothetical protein